MTVAASVPASVPAPVPAPPRRTERLGRVDRIVIGGGAMGLAAAAELTRRGASVLLIERFAPGHTRGASHGATRNFNNAYAEGDYLDLFDEARERWGRLERESGRTLLDLCGLVTHGPEEPVVAAYDALRGRGAEVSLITGAEAEDRWPGMRFDARVLVSHDAGRVRSGEALAALREVATAGGAVIRTGHRVTGIEVLGPDRVRVTARAEPAGGGADTAAETGTELVAEAGGVVVAAGAWSGPLLSGILDLPPLTVTEEHPAHFVPRSPSLVWPSFNHLATPEEAARRGGQVYGMETPGEGVKVGFHAVGDVVDPDHRPFRASEAQRRRLREYVAAWFPGLDPERAVEISCTYTNTASGDFVLDRVGPVTVGAGFSGHGFKFVPAIGRVLADASLGEAEAPARFRLAAHGVSASARALPRDPR